MTVTLLSSSPTTTVSVNQTISGLSQRLPTPILEGDLIVVGGHVSLTAEKNSNISVVTGNFVFVENSVSIFTDSKVSIEGGSMSFKSESKVIVQHSTVLISLGSFNVIDNSWIDIDRHSLINVTGGNFVITESTIFHMIESIANVYAGSALFTSKSIDFELSSLNVYGGDIQFTQESDIKFLFSNITLSGSGNLLFAGDANVDINFGNIDILGGTFIATDNVVTVVKNSNYTINGGDSIFNGTTSMSISNSNFCPLLLVLFTS